MIVDVAQVVQSLFLRSLTEAHVMVDLNMAAKRLQIMRQELLPFMDAHIKGAPEDVQERNRRIAVMERIIENLRILVRDLQSDQHLLAARQRNLRNAVPDRRYSANQSVVQQQQNVENARKQVEHLAEAVRQLMQRNGLLTPVQMGMKLTDLVENIERAADQAHGIHQVMSDLGVPAISPPRAEHASLSSWIPVVVFVVYGMCRIIGKAREP